jgi:hypothetical protein
MKERASPLRARPVVSSTDATQQNVYVGYDDFSAGPDMRVAVASLTAPFNFNVDNKSGTSGGGGINPGHRLAVDPRTGNVYSLFQFNNVVAAARRGRPT